MSRTPLRISFGTMRMSNWRQNGVCSSFQQRQSIAKKHPNCTQIFYPCVCGNYVTDLDSITATKEEGFELLLAMNCVICTKLIMSRRCHHYQKQDAQIEHASQDANTLLLLLLPLPSIIPPPTPWSHISSRGNLIAGDNTLPMRIKLCHEYMNLLLFFITLDSFFMLFFF